LVEDLQGQIVEAYTTAISVPQLLEGETPMQAMARIQTATQRAKAADQLLSRVLGKPAQPTRDETPTLHGDLAQLEAMSLEELSALARGLPTDPEAA
jgi:hypothetical protein